ncbi:hypothetical protein D3C84_509160 [compost metagenome]
MQANAVRRQYVGDLDIAPAFVDAVLFVDLHHAQVELVAKIPHQLRYFRPGVGVADQQRHPQLTQGLGQLGEVAQPEVDLGRGVVVGPPLTGADDVQGECGAALQGGVQGAVVQHPQVGAEPHELAHGAFLYRLSSRPWSSRAWRASSGPSTSVAPGATLAWWMAAAGPPSRQGHGWPPSSLGNWPGRNGWLE